MPTARASRALAVAILAATILPALAVDFGTLFNSPEERARLDRLRRGEPDAPPAAFEPHGPNPLVTGYVTRSDGRDTVWIDGRPVVMSGSEAEAVLKSTPMGAPPIPPGSVKVDKRRAR
jgi:hypothetical protein